MKRKTRRAVPREIINTIIENELRPETDRMPPTAAATELGINPATYRSITKRLRDQGKLPKLEESPPIISKPIPLPLSSPNNPLPGSEMAAKRAQTIEEAALALIAAGGIEVTPEQEDQILASIILNGSENGRMRAIQLRGERRAMSGAQLGPPVPSGREEEIARMAQMLASMDALACAEALEAAIEIRTKRSGMPPDALSLETPPDTHAEEDNVPEGTPAP